MKRIALIAGLFALPLTALGQGGLPGPDAGKELDGMQGDIARFETATKDFRGTVSHVVQQEYVQKRKQLMQKYQAQLDGEEKDEKSRRDSAIKLFEDFLAKYHNDDRWTPDAMFRLAELYFEKSNDEYLSATQQAQTSGAQITPDYSRTIALYEPPGALLEMLKSAGLREMSLEERPARLARRSARRAGRCG